MTEKKIAIYVRSLFPPYLTLQFQEDTCRTICKMRGLNNIEVIQDVENETKNLEDLFKNSSEYSHIVIYSLICIGTSLKEILESIKKVLDNETKLISVTDPVDLDMFGKNPSEKLILSLAIGSAIHMNETWEQIIKFRNQNI